MTFTRLVIAVILAFPAGVLAQTAETCSKTEEKDPCKVVITMSAGCGSGIKVAPDPIHVAKGKTVHIEWEVLTNAWNFDGEGIVIHGGGATFDRVPAEGKKLKFKNKNAAPRTFKYDVILTGPGGRCVIDPIIINH